MKKKLLSNPYKVRLSFKCEKAWKYLQQHDINPCHYLRDSGEKGVIDKANSLFIENNCKCPF